MKSILGAGGARGGTEPQPPSPKAPFTHSAYRAITRSYAVTLTSGGYKTIDYK